MFKLVLGLFAFRYLTATLVVFCIEANVVRVGKLYPRALLTPFTDNVDLTADDERSYGGQARAQRSKEFHKVSVSFQHGRTPDDRSDPPTGDDD